jgi:hypothetical protein
VGHIDADAALYFTVQCLIGAYERDIVEGMVLAGAVPFERLGQGNEGYGDEN